MPCWRHVHFSIGSRHRDARPTAPQLLHSRLSAIAKCSSNRLDKGGTDGRMDGRVLVFRLHDLAGPIGR